MKINYAQILVAIPLVAALIVVIWFLISKILEIWKQTQDNPLFFLVFIIFIIVTPIVCVFYVRNVKRLMKQLALQRNGSVLCSSDDDGFYEGFRFINGAFEVVYQTHVPQKRKPRYSRVKIELPQSAGREMLFIFHESLIIKGLKVLHLKDIQTGNEEFDHTYVIQGDDEPTVLSLLTPDIQRNLLLLKKEKPRVSIEKRQLHIDIHKVLHDTNTINLMIDTTLQLLDRFLEIQK
jgi:hypothetical protein